MFPRNTRSCNTRRVSEQLKHRARNSDTSRLHLINVFTSSCVFFSQTNSKNSLLLVLINFSNNEPKEGTKKNWTISRNVEDHRSKTRFVSVYILLSVKKYTRVFNERETLNTVFKSAENDGKNSRTAVESAQLAP